MFVTTAQHCLMGVFTPDQARIIDVPRDESFIKCTVKNLCDHYIDKYFPYLFANFRNSVFLQKCKSEDISSATCCSSLISRTSIWTKKVRHYRNYVFEEEENDDADENYEPSKEAIFCSRC